MNDKATDKGKGAVKGTLVEKVENVVWSYDTDAIYYVQTAPSEDSYKNYNNLCTIKADGSGQKVLATQTTFVAEGVDPVNDQLNVFKYNVLNCTSNPTAIALCTTPSPTRSTAPACPTVCLWQRQAT